VAEVSYCDLQKLSENLGTIVMHVVASKTFQTALNSYLEF
jgi:hypothetical protein